MFIKNLFNWYLSGYLVAMPVIAVPLTDPTQPWVPQQRQRPTPVATPKMVWRLQAVHQTPKGAVAIVNNTLVRVGQTIAGVRVNKIEHQRVYLANGRILKVFAVTQSQ